MSDVQVFLISHDRFWAADLTRRLSHRGMTMLSAESISLLFSTIPRQSSPDVFLLDLDDREEEVAIRLRLLNENFPFSEVIGLYSGNQLVPSFETLRGGLFDLLCKADSDERLVLKVMAAWQRKERNRTRVDQLRQSGWKLEPGDSAGPKGASESSGESDRKRKGT